MLCLRGFRCLDFEDVLSVARLSVVLEVLNENIKSEWNELALGDFVLDLEEEKIDINSCIK